MAEVRAFRALRYSPNAVGSLQAVAAPPYDTIDEPMRARLVERSPFNVVEIDLPRADGGDPYLHAQTTVEAWLQQGVLVRDRQPGLWTMIQEYELPGTGRRLERRGFFCRARVEDYGPGRIRPHERTQPGPREDRLRLQRATRANLSPIFSLYPDPEGTVWEPLRDLEATEPYAEVLGDDGTSSRLWRVDDDDVIAAVTEAMADRELLIADGHHRYETARVYAREIGGEGEHDYVLMYLCSLSDPGLSVLPTHRLITTLDDSGAAALEEAVERAFASEPASRSEVAPDASDGVSFGFLGRTGEPRRLRLADPSVARDAIPDAPEPYRRLDAAVLEAVVLRGALGMSEEDIANQRGLAYEKEAEAALAAVDSGRAAAAFLLPPTPVERVREVAEAGVPMPPKSTFFYPKVPTGLVFNLLE